MKRYFLYLLIPVSIVAIVLIVQSKKEGPAFAKGSVQTYLLDEAAHAASNVNVKNFSFAQVTCQNKQFIGYWNNKNKLVLVEHDHQGQFKSFVYDGTGGRPDIALRKDDHHYVVSLGCDEKGYIHAAYNMHAHKLKYRRSLKPGSVAGLTEELAMLGANEGQVTYPMFFHQPNTRQLFFMFRDGSSGVSDRYFYAYRASEQQWQAAAGTADGGLMINGKASDPDATAYIMDMPRFDLRGNLHIVWVWRDLNTADTNHDLVYTKWDGKFFYQSNGSPQEMPVTIQNADVILKTPMGGIDIQNGFDIDSYGDIHFAVKMSDQQKREQINYFFMRFDGQTSKPRPLTQSPKGQGRAKVVVNPKNDQVYVIYRSIEEPKGVQVMASKDHFKRWKTSFLTFEDFEGAEVQYDLSLWKDKAAFSMLAQAPYYDDERLYLIRWKPKSSVLWW